MTDPHRRWSLRDALAAVEAQDGFDAAGVLEGWQVLIDTGAVELLGRYHEARARELVLAGLCRPAPDPRVVLPASFWDMQLLEQVRQRYRWRPKRRR